MRILTFIIAFTITAGAIAVPVKKTRDRLRFGYETVVKTEIYDWVPGASQTLTEIQLSCSGDGDQKCRVNQSYIAIEMEDFTIYNASEKLFAQGIIDDGDEDIDNGSVSGSVSQVGIFTNTITNQSYSRTFTYIWVTLPNGCIESQLIIGDIVPIVMAN